MRRFPPADPLPRRRPRQRPLVPPAIRREAGLEGRLLGVLLRRDALDVQRGEARRGAEEGDRLGEGEDTLPREEEELVLVLSGGGRGDEDARGRFAEVFELRPCDARRRAVVRDADGRRGRREGEEGRVEPEGLGVEAFADDLRRARRVQE